MKTSLRFSAALLAVWSVAVTPVMAKVLDRTLATVNGQAVLLSEFDKNLGPVLEQFKKATPPAGQTPERVADIKKRVLDQMVDDRLLAQQCKTKNIHIAQLETDDGVKKVRTRFATEDEFNQELKKEGMTYEEFRKHISDQLCTIKLIDQEVKAKVPPPSDGDVKELYETVDAILHDKTIPGSHTPTELDELKALSGAVQHRFGERVRARHILLRVPPTAGKEERAAALKKMQDIREQLKKGADFAELAKKYSDDPGSKERGGDLGYFSRGDMVPAFEEAAFGTAVGQTTPIVTTDFGYHIIRVEEKKAATKMALDDIKDDLREYLFQQRAAKRFETYIQDLRSKADIKINNLD